VRVVACVAAVVVVAAVAIAEALWLLGWD